MTVTRFTLTVLDGDHLILSSVAPIPLQDQQNVARAFDHWKANGGLLIIGDCAALDKYGVDLELDLDAQRARDKIILATTAEIDHERFINGDKPLLDPPVKIPGILRR